MIGKVRYSNRLAHLHYLPVNREGYHDMKEVRSASNAPQHLPTRISTVAAIPNRQEELAQSTSSSRAITAFTTK
jgi:hypothetical protein